MKKNHYWVFVLLILAITPSCAVHKPQNYELVTKNIAPATDPYGIKLVEENAKSFEGKHKSVLLAMWGQPKSTFTDGLGGEIYKYEHSVRFSEGIVSLSIDMFISKESIVYRSNVKSSFSK